MGRRIVKAGSSLAVALVAYGAFLVAASSGSSAAMTARTQRALVRITNTQAYLQGNDRHPYDIEVITTTVRHSRTLFGSSSPGPQRTRPYTSWRRAGGSTR